MSSRQTTLARSCVDRLASADEGAHEFAIYLGADGIGIDTGSRKELPRLPHSVDARRLQIDLLKARLGELLTVLLFLQRPGHTTDP